MAARISHTDFVQQSETNSCPHCPHGPTLLFERFDKSKGAPRQFFACSAFRDRKVCRFFVWADEWQKKRVESWSVKESNSLTHREQRKRYHKFKKMARKDRHVCCTCGLLLLESEAEDHSAQGHSLKHRVGLNQLNSPSYLFSARDENKTYAQYLFSEKSVHFLLTSIENLAYTNVLCVGAPRIHEAIQVKTKAQDTSLNSMLLDLDERYGQVYPPAKFAKYNMFNHHFFEPEAQERLNQFLQSGGKRTLLLTDPPFGGMVEALAVSFKKISDIWSSFCCHEEPVTAFFIPTMWIFPYFMETRILSHMPPGFHMLDYKVDYDNHNLFQNHHKKKGSPVRIFTNLPASFIPLPPEEGYRFCESCQRYSSAENQHCKECNLCPSKDGTTYIHCNMCNRCVKSTYVHCFKCEMCKLKDHVCGEHLSKGCHICGGFDHKRRDCPRRGPQGSKRSETVNLSEKHRKRKSASDVMRKRKFRRKSVDKSNT